MGVVQTSDPTSSRVWITTSASVKPYLLLLLIYMSLSLLNYFELNFILGITFFSHERSNLWKLVATYS